MRVKDLRKLVEDSPNSSNQRIIIEDDWAKFVDTAVYDSDICGDDTIKYIYIDEEGTLHIHVV